jgi:hypothetical protein
MLEEKDDVTALLTVNMEQKNYKLTAAEIMYATYLCNLPVFG